MIREILEKLIEEAADEPVFLEHTENPEHGDYSTNIALVLAKKLGKNPREVAESILSKVKSQKSKVIEKVEVAGPGFINFFLSNSYLTRELLKIAKEKEKYGALRLASLAQGKKIIVEYSSPNIAKSFGVGHLRSTIIGQAVHNLYTFLGYRCIGINYPGDWGTPHGKILYKLSLKPASFLTSLTVADLEELYVEFHKEAAVNPQLEDEARAWFKKLEQGDKTARKLWEYTRKLSLAEFNRVYKLLDVQIDYLIGESFFEDKMGEIVKEFKIKKLARESQGALIVPFPNDELPPAMLLKTDGTTTYFTRDLANMKYRMKRWKPSMIIIETGEEQILHFKQVFLAARLAGIVDNEKLVHISHGLYRSKEGKFSTRKGETIRLEDVLKEAVARAKTIMESSETVRGLGKKEKDQVAKAVGIGAVKYNDLSQHPAGDIVFNWEKMLNLKGNSGPYLQYTYARCRSIARKAGNPKSKTRNPKQIPNLTKEELDILRTIYRFPEVAREAAEKFSPNLVAHFAFDLAQKYNLFYNTHRVLSPYGGSPAGRDASTKEARDFRLLLTTAVAQILNNSLSLLGIAAPERM